MAIKFLNTVAVDTDVLYVDASSNRVGIGTTSPSVTLHVNGWTRVNGSLQLGGSNRQVMAINNTSLLLGTNNTERMRIDASGNVGIGTTSPSEKLVIADSVDNDLTTLRIENNFGNSSANGTGTALQFYGWDAGITANIKSIRTGQSYSPSVLTFETYGGNGTTGTNSLSERMRIDDFGNVGIGTTSPEEKLQVEGNIRIHGGTDGKGSQLDFGDDYRRLTYTTDDIMSLQSPESVVIMLDNNNNSGADYFAIKKDNLDPSLGTELFRVQENGNVGIGTTSPGAKLHTIGEIVGGTTGFTSGMNGFTGLGSYNSSTAVENIDSLYLRKGGTNGSSTSIAFASA